MRRTALVLASALLARPALAAPDWADDPAAAKDRAYAASQAICRKLKGVTVPAADAPTPAEAAGLADCSSQALYYGIGRPADPKAARLCAFVEKKNRDPQVDDFGFTGDTMLMVIYANGRGAPRNLDLATALACRGGFAPAEIDGRVKHLAKLKADGWTGTDFSPCDDVTSGLMMGVCADHDQLIARATRADARARLTASWTAEQRAALAPLVRAADDYADARGQNETDLGGTGRGAFMVAVEEKEARAFMDLLAAVDAGRLAPADAASVKAADAELNARYQAVMAKAPKLFEATTVTAAGVTSTERTWLRYRDAWLAFARKRYPAVPTDALAARLTRDRSAALAALPASTE